MPTSHLQIPDIAAAQNQKEVTANAAHDLLDKAINQTVAKAITGSTSLTVLETRENALIELTGTPGAVFDLDMPDTNERVLVILNNTDAIATIRNSVGAGTGQPVIAVGAVAFFHYDGTDFVSLAAAAAGDFLSLTDTPGSYSGQTGKTLLVNGAEDGLEFGVAAAAAGDTIVFEAKHRLFHVREEQVSGAQAGSSILGFQTRILNTVLTNEITGASLAANQITLAAGTYDIFASAPALEADGHSIRLRNVTDNVTVLRGNSAYSDSSNIVSTQAVLKGRFVITATKTFEIEHFIGDALATFGLGTRTSTGEVEVYTEVLIQEIAPPPNITRFIAVEPKHRGALIKVDGVQAFTVASAIALWDSAVYDTLFTEDPSLANPFTQSFWLGPNITFTADNTTDQLTAAVHGMVTGDGPLQLTNSGGALPTGLATATDYWVIRIDVNTIQLATSRANAKALTVLTFTTDGTGTHTLDRETRIVIPEGVTKAKIYAAVHLTGLTAAGGLKLLKNGSLVDGGGWHWHNAGLDEIASFASAVLEVSEGDKFEIQFETSGDTSYSTTNALNATWFSVEVIETGNALAGFPTLSVEVPFRGARVDLTTDESIPNSSVTDIPWDAAQIDTGFRGVAFFSGANPTRLTVPAGVTKIRLRGSILFDGVTAITGRFIIRMDKNGANTFDFDGAGSLDLRPNQAMAGVAATVQSGAIDVLEGDFFELATFQNSGIAQNLSSSGRTWFELEVIETDDAEFPALDLPFFVQGIPTAADLVFKHTFARRTEFNDELAGSVGHAEVASTASRIFDVLRNGVSIGSVTFATSQTAAFTTAGGTPEQFEIGDRLTITAPSPADGSMADIAITLKGKVN